MAHSGKAISHVVHSNENVPSRKGRKTQATITIPTLQEEKKFGGGCKLVRWGLFFRMGWNGVLARSCCCCATAHCHATAAAEPPSDQEKRGEEGREEGDPRADPRKLKTTARRQQVREDHEGPCVTRRARWRRQPSRGPREEETARLVS